MNSPHTARILFTLLCTATSLLLATALLHAVAPQWWAERHVYQTNGAGQVVSPLDYGVANAGQLKNFTVAAYEDFRANIPAALGGIGSMTVPSGASNDKGGTGYRLRALVEGWIKLDPSGAVVRDGGGHVVPQDNPALLRDTAQNFASVNVGQLKATAQPFYDRLKELDPSWQYPWRDLQAGETNFTVANVGQMKSVFSFDARRDRDGDGLTDVEELHWAALHGGSINFDPTLRDMDGDGLEDGAEVAAGMDPLTAAVEDTAGTYVQLTVFTPLH